MEEILQERQNIDKSNMFKMIRDTPLHLIKGLEAVKQSPAKRLLLKIRKNKPKYLINCGMGGSALSAEILKLLIKNGQLKMDEVSAVYSNRHYFLPDWIKKVNALVIYNSYSGNTEEVISCLFHGLKMGIQNQIVISSGGKLYELAQKYSLPFIKIPTGLLPRLAINYHFAVLSHIYEMVFSLNIIGQLNRISQELIRVLSSMEKKGYQLALSFKGRIPLIYTSSTLKILGYIWKIKLNENAEIPAFFNHIPEMHHNEIVGLNGLSKILDPKFFYALLINSKDDHIKIKRRIKITKNIFNHLNIKCLNLDIGPNKLVNIFKNIMLADWTSYYLALLYEVDPTPTKIIDKIKNELSKEEDTFLF